MSIKKALTTFLTYGIYSLRVASDLPVQSQYFPIISYYFLFSIFYTLIIMIWFIIANQLLISKEIPYFFDKLANLLSYLKCCKWQASKVVVDSKKEDVPSTRTNRNNPFLIHGSFINDSQKSGSFIFNRKARPLTLQIKINSLIPRPQCPSGLRRYF